MDMGTNLPEDRYPCLSLSFMAGGPLSHSPSPGLSVWPLPSASSHPRLLLQVPFGTSDLAGIFPRLLQVSCTNHAVVDHVVIESVGVAQGVGNQLDLGIQEMAGAFPCRVEERSHHCGDPGNTCPTRS